MVGAHLCPVLPWKPETGSEKALSRVGQASPPSRSPLGQSRLPSPMLAISARRLKVLCNTIGRVKVQVDDFGVQGVGGRGLHATGVYRQRHVGSFSVWTARPGRIRFCYWRASSVCQAGQGLSAFPLPVPGNGPAFLLPSDAGPADAKPSVGLHFQTTRVKGFRRVYDSR